MIRIKNIRMGHATNSSSTHSIVIFPKGHNVSSEIYDQFHYGWEKFVLVDKEDKLDYFATQMVLSMQEHVGAEQAAAICKEWLGVDLSHTIQIPDADESWRDGPYCDVSVDHQSVFTFPVKAPKEFVEAFRDVISDDRVVILGGNDNDGSFDGEVQGQTYDSESFIQNFLDDVNRAESEFMKIRKSGEDWVMYNGVTGGKVRFTLDIEKDFEPTNHGKAETPELVDVKITDYCPFGCEFCYQSSTRDGVHASLETLETVFASLRDMEVFEVALGGGEPTMHPDFAKILQTLRTDYGLTPNFTTFTNKWINDEAKLDAVFKYARGIGVSIHSIQDFEKIPPIIKALDDKAGYGSSPPPIEPYQVPYYLNHQVVAQHVVGSLSLDETIKLIDHAFKLGVQLLLLGYKTVGFGGITGSHDMSGLEMALKLSVENHHRQLNLSIDTAMAQNFPKLCEALDVDGIFVIPEEGKFSCYIDAVDKLYGPSSYIEKSDMVGLPTTTDEYRRIFQEW